MMVDTKKLDDGISVSAFVPPEKLAELAPMFRTIVNNRPDAEEPGQATSAEIEAEARRLGLDYVHIPVVQGQVDDAQIAAFRAALAQRRGPVLAFCRTGRRSAILWALSQAGLRDPDEILKTVAAAGHDLNALRPRLERTAEEA